MLSPQEYYEKYLQGKSQESVLEQITFLRERISRLKYILECEQDHPETFFLPSPLQRIECARDYLEMAKLALEEAGGQYEPTEEELREQAFHRDLTDMHSFTVEIGDHFQGHVKYKYTISGEKVLFDVNHYYSPKRPNLPAYEPSAKKEFLQGIAGLHIGEWKQKYDNPYVLDGTRWNISIEYDGDKAPFNVSGSNAYPFNFDEMLEFLNIDYFDDEEDDD